MLFKLLFWYRTSFDCNSNNIKFNIPNEAVNRVASFIDDQNHFHRIFNEIFEKSPETCDDMKVVDIWRSIQGHQSYVKLGTKEKRRFGRKEFDE